MLIHLDSHNIYMIMNLNVSFLKTVCGLIKVVEMVSNNLETVKVIIGTSLDSADNLDSYCEDWECLCP